MDRENLMPLPGSLAVLMALFPILGESWGVYPMAAAAMLWFALWLTKPRALMGVLLGLIAAL